MPLTISLPPTATDDSAEPAVEPFAEGSALFKVLLPLLAR